MGDPFQRRELRDAAWLALVPLGVAILLGLLLAPRRAVPEELPLPLADGPAMDRVAVADRQLAERARSEPLPPPVRALGSAIRDFHTLEAKETDARAFGDARRRVDDALVDAVQQGKADLPGLRAVQLDAFLGEVRRFNDTGEETEELQALAGAFVRSMKSDGWCVGHALLPNTPVLRVMFKQMWNAFLGFGTKSDLDLTLDEQRTLYAFYLSHPHPSKSMRNALTAARNGAHDDAACRAIVEAERAGEASWLIERIERLAAIDPAYPADYARGIASFQKGELRAAAHAFRNWLDAHPDGPFVLRTQNYLRAVSDIDRVE